MVFLTSLIEFPLLIHNLDVLQTLLTFTLSQEALPAPSSAVALSSGLGLSGMLLLSVSAEQQHSNICIYCEHRKTAIFHHTLIHVYIIIHEIYK